MEEPMDKLFGHSAFDFNHSGIIDNSETSFIEDTYFEDHHGISTGFEEDDSDISYNAGRYTTNRSMYTGDDTYDRLMNNIQARRGKKILITIVIIAAIWIFVGDNIAGALVLLGLYIFGYICDFWR